ncbi:hypothetical protein HMPREF1990_01771 [Porphyromonas gingivalis W4087]|nr:hypothetical protein HMPREF1990_01771 [Porphyromonas gingivalis W4087]
MLSYILFSLRGKREKNAYTYDEQAGIRLSIAGQKHKARTRFSFESGACLSFIARRKGFLHLRSIYKWYDNLYR